MVDAAETYQHHFLWRFKFFTLKPIYCDTAKGYSRRWANRSKEGFRVAATYPEAMTTIPAGGIMSLLQSFQSAHQIKNFTPIAATLEIDGDNGGVVTGSSYLECWRYVCALRAVCHLKSSWPRYDFRSHTWRISVTW